MTRRRRLVATLACGTLLATACTGGATPSDVAAPPVVGEVLWSADHETGDLSQWKVGQGSAVFNTGHADVRVERVPDAPSGEHALVLWVAVEASGPSAARVFRWADNPRRGYYSAWLNFPEAYRPDVWWNVMQFKSLDASGESVPTWVVNVAGDADGMRFYLWNALDGVAHGARSARVEASIPVGEWVHLELYLHRSSERDGRIALWQDGVLLFDLPGQATALGDTLHWSVNNYTSGIDPSEVLLLVDDAMIRSAGTEEPE